MIFVLDGVMDVSSKMKRAFCEVSGYRVHGSRLKVRGSGFRVQATGFRVWRWS